MWTYAEWLEIGACFALVALVAAGCGWNNEDDNESEEWDDKP